MIRKLMLFWLAPIAFFWAWYYLSFYDAGLVFFSRATHDQVFNMYGTLLGIDPASIAPMVAKSLVIDSLILFAILAFRKRRSIAAQVRRYRETRLQSSAIALSDDNLSSAP